MSIGATRRFRLIGVHTVPYVFYMSATLATPRRCVRRVRPTLTVTVHPEIDALLRLRAQGAKLPLSHFTEHLLRRGLEALGAGSPLSARAEEPSGRGLEAPGAGSPSSARAEEPSGVLPFTPRRCVRRVRPTLTVTVDPGIDALLRLRAQNAKLPLSHVTEQLLHHGLQVEQSAAGKAA